MAEVVVEDAEGHRMEEVPVVAEAEEVAEAEGAAKQRLWTTRM